MKDQRPLVSIPDDEAGTSSWGEPPNRHLSFLARHPGPRSARGLRDAYLAEQDYGREVVARYQRSGKRVAEMAVVSV